MTLHVCVWVCTWYAVHMEVCVCVCVCGEVCVYSHDSTLGKGEVLHQDVKTPVLIVEELSDPPETEDTSKQSIKDLLGGLGQQEHRR